MSRVPPAGSDDSTAPPWLRVAAAAGGLLLVLGVPATAGLLLAGPVFHLRPFAWLPAATVAAASAALAGAALLGTLWVARGGTSVSAALTAGPDHLPALRGRPLGREGPWVRLLGGVLSLAAMAAGVWMLLLDPGLWFAGVELLLFGALLGGMALVAVFRARGAGTAMGDSPTAGRRTP